MSRAAYISAYRQDAQECSALATNFGTAWTAQDDDLLVNGPGTVLARAVELGRTYYACVARLAYLREQGVETD